MIIQHALELFHMVLMNMFYWPTYKFFVIYYSVYIDISGL